jgi:hypothetical protein
MNCNIFPGLAILGALLCASCTSSGVSDPLPINDSNITMSFGMARQDIITKSAAALEDTHTSFAVTAYKRFGAVSGQQTVMLDYQVHYDAINKWTYDNIDGQFLKYWDLTSFPYDFCAVAPYSDKISVEGNTFSLPSGNDGIFESQTCTNGVLSPTAANLKEPFLVAHVERKQTAASAWKDYDRMNGAELHSFSSFTNGTANGTTENAEVPLRFHHITAKVGFRLYVSGTYASADDYPMLSAATITIGKTSYITSGTGYKVTVAKETNMFDGAFTSTAVTDNPTLVSDATPANKQGLSNYTDKASAYDLGCADGMVVLPQGNLTLTADFRDRRTPLHQDRRS